MIKTILLILLGLFFLLNGINHLFNSYTLEEYARNHGLGSPKLMVRISGIALIFGGLSLISGFLIIYGIIGLCLFLVLASFKIHRFWRETDKNKRMIEGMHFAKNMAILTELLYIANTLPE